MEKKRKKILSIVGDIAFFAVIGFVALYAVFNGIDKHTGYKLPFFGTRSSVVITPSMSFKNKDNTYLTEDMDQIQINDLITTKMEKYENIDVYEVITFYSNETLICHRVVAKYENENGKYLVTRGDANNTDDEPINYSLYRGTVIKVVPGAGKVVGFFQSPYLYLAICGTVFFVALGFFIYDINAKENKEKAKREKPLKHEK